MPIPTVDPSPQKASEKGTQVHVSAVAVIGASNPSLKISSGRLAPHSIGGAKSNSNQEKAQVGRINRFNRNTTCNESNAKHVGRELRQSLTCAILMRLAAAEYHEHMIVRRHKYNQGEAHV